MHPHPLSFMQCTEEQEFTRITLLDFFSATSLFFLSSFVFFSSSLVRHEGAVTTFSELYRSYTTNYYFTCHLKMIYSIRWGKTMNWEEIIPCLVGISYPENAMKRISSCVLSLFALFALFLANKSFLRNLLLPIF